jgi:cytochrome c553
LRFARIAMLAIVAACACEARAADFIDLRRIEPIHGDADAGKSKATVCGACHGSNGIAAVATFPNLAGQSADYLYWALVEFKRAARVDSPMTAQVAPLGDADMRDLAVYFAALPPAPVIRSEIAHADDARAAALFRNGDPPRGIPPCQGCHGREAAGHPEADSKPMLRAYPMLRGQHAAYIAQRLRNWRNGQPSLSSNDRVMSGIAATLDDDAITAISEWLQRGAP